MSAAGDFETGMMFEQVTFRSDRLVEVAYTEEHDRGVGVALVRNLLIDAPRHAPAELDALITALRDLIDTGLRVLRDPPEQIRAR